MRLTAPSEAATVKGKDAGTISLATIDPTEIVVRTEDYKLSIRRSTRRFVQTYDTGKSPVTETGHCCLVNNVVNNSTQMPVFYPTESRFTRL